MRLVLWIVAFTALIFWVGFAIAPALMREQGSYGGGILNQAVDRSYASVEILSSASDPVGVAGRARGIIGKPNAIITIDSSKSYQTMEGFGATHITLASSPKRDDLSPELRAQAIEAVYGQVRLNTGNIDLGVLETPANAVDPWNQQANDDDDPLHFNWRGFNFDGSDAARQKLIDLAGPKGFDDYYLGLRVSVRWANTWMKAVRSKDYNRYLDETAEQIAAGMIHWRDTYGIVKKYVQLFNEPTSGNDELDPGSIREEIDIIKRVANRLKKEGFPFVKFVVPGEESEERSLEVATAILADAEAREHVGAIAYHPYPYGATYSRVPKILNTAGRGKPDLARVAVRHQLRDLGRKYSLPLWMTEVSNGAVPPRSFDDLRGRAIHIHDELVYADASAYFGMQNMIDSVSVRGRDPFDQEGSIVIVDLIGKKVFITGMGFAIGHYSRWIQRGAVRIEATSDDPLLLVTAFWDESQKRLVLVVINNEDGPTNVSLHLSGFAKLGLLKFTGEQSSWKGAWAPVFPLIYDGPAAIKFRFAPKSVTTIAATL